MKLLSQQLDPAPLKALAEEAIGLLIAGNYSALTEKFGYAVALGRSPSTAIQEDLEASLADLGETHLGENVVLDIPVKYFTPTMSCSPSPSAPCCWQGEAGSWLNSLSPSRDRKIMGPSSRSAP